MKRLAALAVALSTAAADASSPEQAWLEAPDGFSWPRPVAEVVFEDFPSVELDAAMGGALLPNLESLAAPERIPAVWLSLDGGGDRQLLYVDRALSGTGGSYINIVEHAESGWRWIGAMLCGRLHVSEVRYAGWKTLECVGQRGRVLTRLQIVRCASGYAEIRRERHDLAAGQVQVERAECPVEPAP